MKYKRIWKDDRFVISADVFIYEEISNIDSKKRTYRQLQPTFVSEYWEVYALHRNKGLYYAVIGLHENMRVFYEDSVDYSDEGRFYLPIGRDLAFRSMRDVRWLFFSVRNGRLANVTTEFFQWVSSSMYYVSFVAYYSPLVCLSFKSVPRIQQEMNLYLLQTEEGYESVEEEVVRRDYPECLL